MEIRRKKKTLSISLDLIESIGEMKKLFYTKDGKKIEGYVDGDERTVELFAVEDKAK
jgi:hypothetical protein